MQGIKIYTYTCSPDFRPKSGGLAPSGFKRHWILQACSQGGQRGRMSSSPPLPPMDEGQHFMPQVSYFPQIPGLECSKNAVPRPMIAKFPQGSMSPTPSSGAPLVLWCSHHDVRNGSLSDNFIWTPPPPLGPSSSPKAGFRPVLVVKMNHVT